MTIAHRALVFAGGLAGALGVALSAVAAHAGADGNLATAASFLILHAPVLLLAGFVGRGRVAGVAGFVILAGLALFSGDLLARTYLGSRLFPYAAPGGGLLLIAGWLLFCAAAVTKQEPAGR